jgi:hypothetical protein
MRGNRAGDIVEIVSRYDLPDPEDELIVEESLAIPQLIKFGTVKRFKPGKAVIALETTGLPIGILAIESKKLNTEGCTFPGKELFGVKIRADDQGTVPAPFAGLFSSGKQTISVREPKAAEPKPGVFGYL